MPSIAHGFADFIDKLVFPYRTRVAVPLISQHSGTIQRFKQLLRPGATKTQIVEALDEVERMRRGHEERGLILDELETIVERALENWHCDGR